MKNVLEKIIETSQSAMDTDSITIQLADVLFGDINKTAQLALDKLNAYFPGLDQGQDFSTIEWQRIEVVQERSCQVDTSGIYTMINRREEMDTFAGMKKFKLVRVDVMTTTDDAPLVSFESSNVDAIRKTLMHWFLTNNIVISTEHASYIGLELYRAKIERHYVQA